MQELGIISLFKGDFRLKLFLEGAIIGAFVGILVVAFRIALQKAEQLREHIYVITKVQGAWGIIAWFALLLLIGLLLAYIVRKVPMSGGSGIPQVKGVLQGQIKIGNPFLLILGKFIGGVIGIGAGLSLGREGPSVQLGASVGQIISRSLGRLKIEEKYLITCGASAGLAAAFNAPFAGVIFALEEMHRNFSPTVLISVMAASISADVVTQNFFGQQPIFNFQNIHTFPLSYLLYLIGLGILCGLFGFLFNISLIKSSDFYKNIRLPKLLHPVIPLFVSGVLGFYLPEVLGGGNNLVQHISVTNISVTMVVVIFAAKFIFTMLSYGSGVPGGIFLPLLVLGSLTGYIYGNIVINIIQGDMIYVGNFMIYAMAAYFTAIVKAPVTGSILITEMTGSFEHLLPLILVSMTAYIIADVLKSKPVYEMLYNRILAQQKLTEFKNETTNKVIHEFVVCLGSPLDGKKVKDILWPDDCLLISVKRGEYEMIPKGNTRIKSGDYLYAIVEEKNLQKYQELSRLCTEKNN